MTRATLNHFRVPIVIDITAPTHGAEIACNKTQRAVFHFTDFVQQHLYEIHNAPYALQKTE